MICEVTDDNFEVEVARSAVPCVVEFSAGWCDSCDAMAPVLEEVGERLAGEVKMCHVDIDANRKLRILFAVAAIPYTVLVHDGLKTPLFDEMVGADRLEERIRFVLDGGAAPTTSPLGKLR